MGRKIPGKKHKGVKDPEKQQAKRLAAVEHVINQAPKDVDEQAIPRSLERVMKLKELVKNQVKNGKVKKKKKKNRGSGLITVGDDQVVHSKYPKSRPEKVVPIFSQRPGENNYHFLQRVDSETKSFINETEFENKFNVDVQRDPESGRITNCLRRKKDEITELEKLKSKHKNIKKKPKLTEKKERLSKYQKRKRKLDLKKAMKEGKPEEKLEVYREQIKFGEVAQAPPELKFKGKVADATSKNSRKGLLLSSMLEKSKETVRPVSSATHTTAKSVKRKNLPIGERMRLDKQQEEVISLYRSLKASKRI